MVKKIYIAGKINGLLNFKEIFDKKKKELEDEGYVVLSPADLPNGMEYEDYMVICYAMIDVADAIYFLPNWVDSSGAKRERHYALSKQKVLLNLEEM